MRKSPEERKREILDAAVRLIGERGFNGISIQDVADEVGISKQGLLRYVGSKDNMLAMTFTDYYATSGTVEEFMESKLPGSDPEHLRFPSYLRFLVRHNAQRREMVRLFSVLHTEALNPGHPLYDEFSGRNDQIWQVYSLYSWEIPPQMGDWDQSMRPIVRRAMEAMDGVQLRWLSDPPIDLYDEWLEFERMLFPSPMWDGYR
ncbi:AcrR family transcriptional regulator [Bifidobacterium eulemuris]|uniref:AcrR family transcriptional regulator n=1 Tax=Bifidobacterium eulemuris TaxID=1765219 RepID=A0A261FYI8_9BIFI|nr:AcrR family transcriptional regulator [Bifidobacterium eulemuris]